MGFNYTSGITFTVEKVSRMSIVNVNFVRVIEKFILDLLVF